MEYRHGPISVAGPSTLVWFLGGADDDLVADDPRHRRVGQRESVDPMAELVHAPASGGGTRAVPRP